MAVQLIGLMTDDALMTAACDLFSLSVSLRVLGLYVTVAADKGKVTRVCFLNCSVCVTGFGMTAVFQSVSPAK